MTDILPRNSFINWLAKDPRWGASDVDKRPLFLGNFLRTNNQYDIVTASKETLDQLPTLDEIDSHPSLVDVNRAYRLHAADNLVVSFDIEPSSDPSYIQYYANMDAHYKEYSRNNGVHLYYVLKRGRLSPNALNMLLTSSVYKYPNKLDTLVTDKPFEYELLMNNHWVTFTNKVIDHGILNVIDDAPNEIYDMVEHAAQIIQQRTEIANPIGDITIEETDVSKKLTTLIYEDTQYVDAIRDITPDEYDGDMSRYEFACAIRIANILLFRLRNPKPFDAMFLEVDLSEIDVADKVSAILTVLSDIIPERDKHWNHFINGVPYIVHQVKNALQLALESHK